MGGLFGWEIPAYDAAKAGAGPRILLISGGANLAILGVLLTIGDFAKFTFFLVCVFACAATVCWRAARIAWTAMLG
jgi:hypothetical protein